MTTVPPCKDVDRCSNLICYHRKEHNKLASCDIFCNAKLKYLCTGLIEKKEEK